MSSTAVDIFNFLKNFEHILPKGMKKRLLDIHSKIEYRDKLSKIKNRFGEHYDDCVWSKSNCTTGPDTCHCSVLKRCLDEKVYNIMDTYAKIYNQFRCKHCK